MLPTIVAMPLLAAMWIEAPGPVQVQALDPAGAPEVAVEIAAEDQGRGGRGGNQGQGGAPRPPSGPPPGGRPPPNPGKSGGSRSQTSPSGPRTASYIAESSGNACSSTRVVVIRP